MTNFPVKNVMVLIVKRACLERGLNVRIAIEILILEALDHYAKIAIAKINSYPVLSFIIRQDLDSRVPIVLLNVVRVIRDESMGDYLKIAHSVILILSKALWVVCVIILPTVLMQSIDVKNVIRQQAFKMHALDRSAVMYVRQEELDNESWIDFSSTLSIFN